MENKAILLLILLISSALFVICNAEGPGKKLPPTKPPKDQKSPPNKPPHKDQGRGPKDARLKDNFYKDTCPNAEDIVRTITTSRVAKQNGLAAKLLRLHYHDCFVRGCDASVLLDSTPGSQSERESKPNLTLEGLDVIEEIKTAVEKECDQIVSCADILALAARDAVSYKFGKPMWKVPTGRRDGTVSRASEALFFLPSPFSDFKTLQDSFILMGLSIQDLVTLSGAHTIGVAHCAGFRKRLFNFTGAGDQDPSIDPTYADFLKTKCQNPNDKTTTADMDPTSSVSFDNHYYMALNEKKGLFQSDAALLTNNKARDFAQQLLKPKSFYDQFALSMQKMGAIQVLTGSNGQIRKHCHAVNP